MFKLLMTVIFLLMFLPLNVSAQSRNVEIDGDHGKLAAVVQTPDGKSNFPMVIICHGFTGDKESKLLTSLADYLEAAGIASIRFDFNGHGKSEGRFQDMTVLNEIEDAKHVYEYVRDMRGVTSVSIAGHSQGGVVTSMVAGELGVENVKAIALMAAAAVLRDDAIRGILQGNTYDSINVPEYIELNHRGKKILGRDYVLTAQTLPIYETAANFQGPVFIIHGTTDIVVPYTYSLRYQEIYPGSQLELLPGYDHGFSQNEKLAARKVADFFISQLK